ncbi:MAG: hypothetical protein CYG59_16525 [Chloroflexi bacterium]|nr:MAG: hypothetical protein CYG59_16525 [Chloroflexota bacterium]
MLIDPTCLKDLDNSSAIHQLQAVQAELDLALRHWRLACSGSNQRVDRRVVQHHLDLSRANRIGNERIRFAQRRLDTRYLDAQ